MPHTSVAIVGASFAGLSSLLALRKRLGNDVTITLFDQREHFTYIPGLHEAVLNTERLKSMQFTIADHYPEFHHEKISSIQKDHLITVSGEIWTFDYCVIATGARTRFFGNDEWEKIAYTVSYACDIPKLNTALTDPSTKTITVVGGGYTGVEIASIIAQRKRDDQKIRVVHGAPRLFERLSEYISQTSLTWLAKNNVEVIMDTRVTDITENHITLSTGETLASDVTIVSRGIQANDEAHRPNLTFEKSYQPLESNRIYAAGDVAIHGLYTTAHNAIFEGRRVGNLIADSIQGVTRTYPALTNRDKLAIALGARDGIFTNGEKGIFVPWLIGCMNRIIEKRVLIEFKWRVMLPV